MDENYESIMNRIGSIQAMDKILKHKTNEKVTDKQQKQRVGVNPVLGNAGVMWESGNRVSTIIYTGGSILCKHKNSEHFPILINLKLVTKFHCEISRYFVSCYEARFETPIDPFYEFVSQECAKSTILNIKKKIRQDEYQ
jgi:hypothetical protein